MGLYVKLTTDKKHIQTLSSEKDSYQIAVQQLQNRLQASEANAGTLLTQNSILMKEV